MCMDRISLVVGLGVAGLGGHRMGDAEAADPYEKRSRKEGVG